MVLQSRAPSRKAGAGGVLLAWVSICNVCKCNSLGGIVVIIDLKKTFSHRCIDVDLLDTPQEYIFVEPVGFGVRLWGPFAFAI